MGSTLVATPTPLLIPVSTGQFSADCEIAYVNAFYPFDVHLWWRKVGSSWTELEIDHLDGFHPDGQGLNHGGRFTQRVEVGQVFEFALFASEQGDPNIGGLQDPPPDAWLVVAGLREEADLITRDEFGVGGTWCEASLSTNTDCFVVLQVSTEEPQQNDDQTWTFTRPPDIGTLASDGYAQTATLVLDSPLLLPGNDYHALVQVIDGDGNWQYSHHPFTTKQREVTVAWKELHVINDGSTGGGNNAAFEFWLMEGRSGAATIVRQHSIPRRRINDRPSPGHRDEEFIDLGQFGQPDVVGPTVITSQNADIAVLVRGLAEDDFGEDDPAGNFEPGLFGLLDGQWDARAFYAFPWGKDSEEVVDDPHAVHARPLDGDEFDYVVTTWFTVTYV